MGGGPICKDHFFHFPPWSYQAFRAKFLPAWAGFGLPIVLKKKASFLNDKKAALYSSKKNNNKTPSRAFPSVLTLNQPTLCLSESNHSCQASLPLIPAAGCQHHSCSMNSARSLGSWVRTPERAPQIKSDYADEGTFNPLVTGQLRNF